MKYDNIYFLNCLIPVFFLPLLKKELKHILYISISITTLFLSCKDSTINKNLKIFKYNEYKNISSLDPAFAKDNSNIWAVNQIFNGLVEMNDSLNIKPSIAKKWKIDSTNLHYTFTIKDNVYFHEHYLFKQKKRKVTAKDFEYSLFRLKSAETASPGKWVLNNVNSIKAINDSTLKIDLEKPFPAFLGLLSMKYCSVVPKEIVEGLGNEFGRTPIGTGPFKFKIWKENIKLVLRKNESYFEFNESNHRLPFIDAISVTFLADKQSEFMEFYKGNLDFISGIDDSYKDFLLTSYGELKPEFKEDISLLRTAYLNTEYLAFNLDRKNIFSESIKLRQALNMCFDRKKMVTFLRNGIGKAANGGFIPIGLPGHYSEGYTYNPESAKEIVRTYCKNNNIISLPPIKLTTTNEYLNICEYIQREAYKVGLNLEIDVIPAPNLKESKSKGKLDLFRASWIADYPDAENYLSLFYSKNFAPNGPNYSHFKNKEFDNLYNKSLVATSTKSRIDIYKKMDSLEISQSPIIPLFYDEVVRFSQNNIENLGINPINLLNLKTVKKH